MLRELEHITLNQLIIALANSVVEEKKEKGVSLSNGERNNIDFDAKNMQENVKEYGVGSSNFNNEYSDENQKIGVPTYPPSKHNYVNNIVKHEESNASDDAKTESETTKGEDKEK